MAMAARSSPLVVVGPQFCAPHALPLTLTMKYYCSCIVTDAGDAVVLRVDVPFTIFRRRRDILLDAAAGVPVLSMQPMYGGMGIAWQVFRGDSNSAGDLLFTARAASRRWPLRGLDVFLARNTRRKVADFKIKGNFRRSCYIYLGSSDTMIASMNRMKSFGRPVLGVTVFPNIDHAFITALVLILHHVYATIEENRRREDSSS